MATYASSSVTTEEAEQIAEANSSDRQPVVFIHGLWLLPSSWDRWALMFEDAGYATLTPSWPDDPQTVEEARAQESQAPPPAIPMQSRDVPHTAAELQAAMAFRSSR